METLEQALESETKQQKWLGFKLFIDTWIHLVAFIFIIYFCMKEDGYTAFCCFYYGIGGYQFLSAMIHLAFPNAFQKRKTYYVQLFVYLFMFLLVGFGFLFQFANGLLILLFFLLLLTPISAIYYFVISLNEYNEFKNQKWH